MKTTVKITLVNAGTYNIYRFNTEAEAADFYAERKAHFDAMEDCPWAIELIDD